MIPCPTYANCPPCDDPPILNLSSEAPDVFYRYTDFTQPSYPRLGERPTAQGNTGTTRDTVPPTPGQIPIPPPDSVQPPEITDPQGDPVLWYGNSALATSVTCKSGGAYYAFMSPNLVIDRSTAEANAKAMSLLVKFAKEHKFCMAKASFPACLYQSVFENFSLDGGTGPFTWFIIAGAIPAGLVFGTAPGDTSIGQIYGIAAAPGTGFVIFKIYDAYGNFLVKQINWSVMGITNASALPDATNGDPYSVVLIGAGGTGAYDFYLNSGTLPDGLTLEQNGTIHGTPIIADDEEFTFEVKIDDGIQTCFYTFTINAHSY